jgi:hypothetical protein
MSRLRATDRPGTTLVEAPGIAAEDEELRAIQRG